MRRIEKPFLLILVCFFISILIPACSTDDKGTSDITGRQSEFVSAELDYYSNSLLGTAGEATSNYDSLAEMAREIEEADIIKIDDSTLYILNRYRGLIVCDISQPDNPSISGRVLISGEPVEMYIRDGLAYIIVSSPHSPIYVMMEFPGVAVASSDAFEAGSRLEVVDITDKTMPQVIRSFDVEGEVADSRIVGHILYVVSSEQENTYIASIDISDTENIREADREDLGGSAEYVHVTEEAIFIASPKDYYWNDQTTISYIDISDTNGAIVKRGSINLPGGVKDEFKMDYHDSFFRVCTYEWKEGGMSNLFVVDVRDPDNMKQIGSVELGRGEQLFATRFDKDRAYMVTFERIDPLWTIDLSDPSLPEIKGELEIPGWSTHIEPKGDRLIALGVDDSSGRKVSVSLFDISNLEEPSLIKRVSFGEDDGWSYSDAYQDVKAFTILDEMGLILLPYTTSFYNNGQSWREDRLQLIDYSTEDLTARGWVKQNGSVLRSRSVEDRLFSVSSDEFQVIDASDRDKPEVKATLTLASNIVDFTPLQNDYGVQVKVGSNGEYTLRVVPLSDPDTGEAVSEVVFDGSYSSIIGNGNLVYLISNHYEYQTDPTSLSGTFCMVRIFDFSSPSNPIQRGHVEIPDNYYGTVTSGGGTAIYPYFSWGEIVKIRDDVLVFVTRNDYYFILGEFEDDVETESSSERFKGLRVVDLSNPDAPVITSEYPMEITGSISYFANNDVVFFSHMEAIDADDQGLAQVKHYLGRVDVSDPSAPKGLPSINIPGICVSIEDSGTYGYTINGEWGQTESLVYTFNVVKFVDDKAYLLDNVELDNYFYSLVVADGLAYLSEYGWYWEDSDNLVIIDLTDPQDLTVYENSLSDGMFNVIGAKNHKLFVNMSGGIGCYDTSNPAEPLLEDFKAQVGWAGRVVFSEDKAYVPMGYYGLWFISVPN